MSIYTDYNSLKAIRTYKYYDYMFKLAAYQFFGGENKWAIRLKAQGIAESCLTMTENSITHAFGVMQVMPDTFKWLTEGKMDIKESYANIMTGSLLMAHYYGKTAAIKDKMGVIVGPQIRGFRPLDIITDETEKWKFCLAGYNCGIGHITGKKSGTCCWEIIRSKGGDVSLWESSAAVLPLVTGKNNAKQTTDYVARIVRVAGMMEEAGEYLV